jgi:integrase
MPRQRKPAPAPKPRGVRWRKGRAYYECEHRRLVGGRLFVTLETRDQELAETRAAALNALKDRGDWAVIERLRSGELHITDIARAAREGEWNTLRRLEGTRLGQAVDKWLRETEATHPLKPQTARLHRYALDALLGARGRDCRMANETRESAAAFLHEPKPSNRGESWAANTQRANRTIYTALWKMVIEDEAEAARPLGLMPATTDNPWRRVKVPKVRATRHAFLTPEQWARLIDHPKVRDTPTAAFLGVCCLAGLRQAEATYLRPTTDVDFASGLLHVQDRAGRHAWTAKVDTTQRDIPMVPALRRLLERHVELGFAGERFFFRLAGKDAPISSDTTAEWCKAAFEAAGIRYGRREDSLTLHSCRHTFGTWLTLDGVPFTVTASLMGDDPRTVMFYYAHYAPSDRDAAMARIQERVGAGK